MSSSCWVEMTTASTRTGWWPSYSTVTCDLPSGRRYLIAPLLRLAASRRVRSWASVIGSGISDCVSRQAKPNIMPWSPAPVSSKGSRSPVCLTSSDWSTPMRDVGRLLVDRDAHAAGLGVEADRRAVVADLADRLADDARDVDVGLGRDLAGDVDLAR